MTVVAFVLTVAWLPADPAVDRIDLRALAARIDLSGIILFATALSGLMIFLDGLPHLVVAVTLVFGVALGTFAPANQTALYRQAEADQIGTAAGLLRTFGYIGSVAPSALIGIFFRTSVSDHGLHTIGAVMSGASLLGVVLVLADPEFLRRSSRRAAARRRATVEQHHRASRHRPAG